MPRIRDQGRRAPGRCGQSDTRCSARAGAMWCPIHSSRTAQAANVRERAEASGASRPSCQTISQCPPHAVAADTRAGPKAMLSTAADGCNDVGVQEAGRAVGSAEDKCCSKSARGLSPPCRSGPQVVPCPAAHAQQRVLSGSAAAPTTGPARSRRLNRLTTSTQERTGGPAASAAPGLERPC